jgi:hypothetical protein
VGERGCTGDHNYVIRDLGAGVARLECSRCQAVVIDLDAARDGSNSVTVPGLFGPARPTIFSVLGEERRRAEEEAEKEQNARGGGRYSFGGGAPRR